MKYPKWLKEGDLISVTAPSGGVTGQRNILRLNHAKQNIEKLGYHYKETKNVRTEYNGRSSTPHQRAEEFLELWKSNEVSAILMATGGDFLLEIFNNLDLKELEQYTPKWIQGYSDITSLSFVITTLLDIATIYGPNVKSYGMEPIYPNLINALELMKGNEIVQESFEKYESFSEEENPYAPYYLTEKNEWKEIKEEKEVSFTGRSIGGNFDVIQYLMGTPYDRVKDYVEKYKQDGIIWFLEIYHKTTTQVYLQLWQMKKAGYFKNCKGILFGKSPILEPEYNIDFKQTIKQALGDLEIPILYDTDIGHIGPQIPIVNGGVLQIEYKEGKGKIKTIFKE